MHHLAVALDEELVGDLDGADLGDAAGIVAAEVEQHQVLGALLRIGEQLGLERLVLVRGGAARPRAGDRAHGDRAAAHLHQDLRARAGDGELAEVEEVEVRGGVDPAQRAVERERRQLERRLEALRQHHLEDVAGGDVFLGGLHHALVFGRRGVGRRQHRQRAGVRLGGGMIERLVERIDDDGEPVARARQRGLGRHAFFRAHRRDHRDGVLDRVEHDHDGRPHQHGVGQADRDPGWATAASPSAGPCRSRDSRRCRRPSAAARRAARSRSRRRARAATRAAACLHGVKPPFLPRAVRSISAWPATERQITSGSSPMIE